MMGREYGATRHLLGQAHTWLEMSQTRTDPVDWQ